MGKARARCYDMNLKIYTAIAVLTGNLHETEMPARWHTSNFADVMQLKSAIFTIITFYKSKCCKLFGHVSPTKTIILWAHFSSLSSPEITLSACAINLMDDRAKLFSRLLSKCTERAIKRISIFICINL